MTGITGTTMLGEHEVLGTGTAGTAVTLSGAAVFNNAASYVCYGSDTTSAGSEVVFSYTNGSTFTPNTTVSGDSVKFICIGVTTPS